jgi:hypothetical protein
MYRALWPRAQLLLSLFTRLCLPVFAGVLSGVDGGVHAIRGVFSESVGIAEPVVTQTTVRDGDRDDTCEKLLRDAAYRAISRRP